jgi:hypothetical protein
MEASEGLHRHEINVAYRTVTNLWNRRFRIERTRWKIHSYRKNVLTRKLMKHYPEPQVRGELLLL